MYSRICSILSLSFIVITLVFAIPVAGFAQAPDPAKPYSQDNENELSSASLTLGDWGYEDVILAGPYGQASYDLGLPSHWKIVPGGSIQLYVNYQILGGVNTLLGNDELLRIPTSNIQVALNDKLIYQTNLYDIGEQTLWVTIPDEWPDKINERDRLDVFLNVYGPCEDVLVTTLSISKDSDIKLFYRPIGLDLDLSDYPHPIYQRTFLPSSAYMILPENASSQVLTAGLYTAAGLGSLANNQVVLTATNDIEWDQNESYLEHMLIVGTPVDNHVIREVDAITDLPIQLKIRRFSITSSGPDVVIPAGEVTYNIRVENPESTSIEGLSAESHLPIGISNVNCDPECTLDGDQAVWDIPPINSNATADFSISFTLPVSITSKTQDFTTQLSLFDEIVNVSTLSSNVDAEANPDVIQANQTSDFFFVMDEQAIAETMGVIQFVPSPWQLGKALLIVTGLTDDAVTKSGLALGTKTYFPGMMGGVALIQDVNEQSVERIYQGIDITFDDLGYSDRVLTGTGLKKIFYSFDLPTEWLLTQDASIHFQFSHSILLDPERSSLTLYLNDSPFATTALDESNAVFGEITAQLPMRESRPGQSNTLMVEVAMELPDRCVDPETSQAWVRLDASSSLRLDHTLSDLNDYTDLDYWPLPFASLPDLSEIRFVIPDQPTDMEYTAALRTVSYLANATGNGYFRPTIYVGMPVGLDQAAYHWIAIGRPTRNPILQSVNEILPQPFFPGSDHFQQVVDNVVFQLPPDIDLGYLQLIASPWDEGYSFLAVTGTSDLGVEWAARSLVDPDQRWKLEGNLVLLRGADELVAIDTRGLTSASQIEAIATAIPEVGIIDTDTATATPVPTPTPLVEQEQEVEDTSDAVTEYDSPVPTTDQHSQNLQLFVIGGGILSLLIILGISIIQARRNKRTR